MLKKSSLPLLRHITGFLEYCEVEKGLSQLSIKSYARFIEAFRKWALNNGYADMKPHELTGDHLWRFRVFLARYTNPDTKKPLKKTTQNFYMISIRQFLAYLTDRDILSLPAEKIKLQKENTLQRKVKFLTLQQLVKLFKMPDIQTVSGLRDRAILETLFSSGLRVAELVSLNRNQFNPKLMDQTDEYELNVVGKGDRPRTVYFSQRSLQWLKKYLETRYDAHEPLFINLNRQKKNKRLTSRSVERIVGRYSKMAGLPFSATPHTLRHTYATDLLNQGVDLRMIQEFLGHKNIATTQIYTHVTNKKLKEIHKSFHSGNKL